MKYRSEFIFFLVFFIGSFEMVAQNSQKKTSRIQVEYVKEYNQVENLVATLRVRERNYVPMSGVNVHFYSVNDTSSVLLGTSKTDALGKATFEISNNDKVYSDSLGMMTFEVEYKGNAEIKNSKRSLSVKRANIAMLFIKIDTVKSMEVKAIESVGEETIPIGGLGVSFFIEGTFSLYKIDEAKTDDNGTIRIPFPSSMPGDTAGVLTIFAKVQEDEVYGTIEVKDQINWGKPIPLPEAEHRGLGDTDAPLWMVYTLIILLSAVWFHYLYVIYLIIKIKLARRGY